MKAYTTEGESEELTFGERVEKIYRRIHRADKRNTGMYLNCEELGDLAYALSNQISSVVYPE